LFAEQHDKVCFAIHSECHRRNVRVLRISSWLGSSE
jgi:hypothetical protein